MAGKIFIYSTLSNDNRYSQNVRNANGVVNSSRSVVINGGANVASLKGVLQTPKGVVTEVSDADYEWLKNEPNFKAHVKAGFLTVDEKSKSSSNPEKVAKDMQASDNSAPYTDQSLEKLAPTKLAA